MLDYFKKPDISLPLIIVVSPHYQTQIPKCTIHVNGMAWQGELTDSVVKKFSIPLLAPIDIVIILEDKNYNIDHTTAVIVDSIEIDGCELIQYTSDCTSYVNDHKYTQHTTHIGFNGVWKFSIAEPFYRWHHRVSGNGWLLEP
jgi:hypothetical protein